MSRDLVVAWAGRHRRDSWDLLCDRYRKRIQRYIRLQDKPIRVRKVGEDRARLKDEGEALLAAVPDNSWIVALDRRGEMRSSKELATWLRRKIDDWPGEIVFLIGSDLGLDQKVLEERIELVKCRKSAYN